MQRHKQKCRLGWHVVAIAICLIATAPAFAQSGQAADLETLLQREIVVGTKEAAPFAMKAPDGQWTGISIDLWRRIAEEKNIKYRLHEEETVPGLIDAVAKGKVDIAVAALTVTSDREKILDFTSAFYGTGLGIAVPVTGGVASWAPVLRALTSVSFLQSVLALIGLALLVGLVVWLLERRHNEEFGGTIAKGLSSSVYWTTVAMTQRGIGHQGPRTMPGRFVAMLWMVGSIITVAVFTAAITSALTVRQLQGNVHGVTDLSKVRVGAVAGSSTEETLGKLRISFEGYPSAKEGLQGIRDGALDAFVYDRPLLAWTINQGFRSSIQLLDVVFDQQHYAFALPAGSPLRKPVSIALLNEIRSTWWGDTMRRYLGNIGQ